MTTKQSIALEFVREHKHFFRKDVAWFEKNWHIVSAFSAKALEELRDGATHCASREIIYFLSMRTGATEDGGQYKIGNDNGADLARIFSVMYPNWVGVWDQRRADTEEFLEAVCALEAV